MKEYTTLYIADDHQIVVDGLRLLISNEPTFRVIGSSNDGDTAYKEILLRKPDLALIDIRMPGMNGIQLIVSLKKHVNTLFIILSMHNDRRYITDAINNGASAYLLKNTGKKELFNCITQVMAGKNCYPSKPVHSPTDRPTLFTPRELEILKLVISEFTTQQIAEQLHLSHYTIETHRKNICRKANSKSVLGLAKYAAENNIDI